MAASASSSTESLLRPLIEAFLPLELRPLPQQSLKSREWEAAVLLVDH